MARGQRHEHGPGLKNEGKKERKGEETCSSKRLTFKYLVDSDKDSAPSRAWLSSYWNVTERTKLQQEGFLAAPYGLGEWNSDSDLDSDSEAEEEC
jgi:hypothetical protein